MKKSNSQKKDRARAKRSQTALPKPELLVLEHPVGVRVVIDFVDKKCIVIFNETRREIQILDKDHGKQIAQLLFCAGFNCLR